MHPANQRPRKPDKLSQGAHNQTSYPRIQWENTLDKRGLQNPSNEPGGEQSQEKPESGSNNNRGECKVKSKSKNI